MLCRQPVLFTSVNSLSSLSGSLLFTIPIVILIGHAIHFEPYISVMHIFISYFFLMFTNKANEAETCSEFIIHVAP